VILLKNDDVIDFLTYMFKWRIHKAMVAAPVVNTRGYDCL